MNFSGSIRFDRKNRKCEKHYRKRYSF